MSLTVGSRLGSHEILGLLGAGGMGEVFLAHDTKLKRRVAIKILPAESSADPDRIARFHREAQAVAALNHPGIAAIYDLAESDGVTFLVLELVEGETLAERLRRGALPVEEAMAVARQMLEALEAAHDKGICHRDLKPANIKVTAEGVVKILDFGLARFLERGATADTQTTVAQTSPGAILGTAGYMSPEQAKGLDADERSDIFSFGCVFYELLTGRRAFAGGTTSEAMANILLSEVDLAQLPPAINPRLVEILARCLEKNPKQRWHAAADVRLQLEGIATAASRATPAGASSRPLWQIAVTTTAALIAVVLTGYAAWTLKPEPSRSLTRFMLTLPEGQQFSHVGRPVLAVSPDGSNLVYVANRRLYLRPMAGFESHVIPGSELADGVQSPVFSPDGQWIAFRSVGDATLKRLPITGGAPVTIGPNATPFGLSWDEQGILFGEFGKGILRVAPEGGTPEVIVQVSGDEMADSPQLLPGGHVLFSVKKLTDDWDHGQIVVQAVSGGPRKILVNGGAAARYVPTGHLIYAVANVLFAVPFDVGGLTVTGGAVSVVEGVNRGFLRGPRAAATAQYAISNTGSLAFVPGTRGAQLDGALDLAMFDRTTAPQRLGLPPAPYGVPRASRDGKWAALERESGGERDVWIVDLTGSAAIRRLTFGGKSRAPIWSGDSSWVIFQSEQNGATGLFRQRADGSGTAERLTTAEAGAVHVAQSASADGAHLLLTVVKDGRQELWDLTLGDRRMAAFGSVQSPAPIEAAFSPDGRWVAYSTGVSAAGTRVQNITEAFVQPFPATGAKYQIPSPLGASRPVWAASGGAILIGIGIGRDAVVPVTTSPRFEFGQPEAFTLGARLGTAFNGRRNFDPVPDGRILGLISPGPDQSGGVPVPQVAVVLNWFDELRAKVR